MQGKLFSDLKQAKTPFEATKAMMSLEDRLTPLELQAMQPSLDELSGLAREAVERSNILRELRAGTPEPYSQRALAKDVVFYSSAGGEKRESLIIALCGRSHRLMSSLSLFLQHIPAARFDIVILTDRSNNHFFNGVGNYASDLLSLVRRVTAEVGADKYRRVYCFGTSAGGFPALRFGILCGAFRSISIGGVFAWPIQRLRSGAQFQAYDPLCVCSRERHRHLVCVHASDAKRDFFSAAWLQTILQVSRVPVANSANHNIVYDIYLAGRLRDLYSMLFDFPVSQSAHPHRQG